MPTPLPSLDSLSKMPWYAPLGGLAGAVAVFGGLAFIDKVGAGPFNGLTLTANILTSLAMDALGLFQCLHETGRPARIDQFGDVQSLQAKTGIAVQRLLDIGQ